ncbi:MAG: hypothetical protein CMK64_15090 [Pseudoalteromonas sp.]|uniref:hypothetical protein n=1 Tax=Pseudoalteromonas phenolica TaxID=161398 RepID=UPI000C091F7A|nr:hypothetical protein [Pseudoalteromonas sp.]|tara:strand:+ start:2796 stop:3302 length:507 start_codon:yes stop_codon:yes gene_type:complete
MPLDLNSAHFSQFLLLVRDNATILTFFSVVLFAVLKDDKALRYAALCAAFYVVGYFSYPVIKKIDADFYVIRYIYWALSDIVFMAILAVWALRDKVYLSQSILAQLIVLPAPIMQLFRLVDRHYLDLSYSTYLYKSILPLVNILTVLLCFLPVVYILKSRVNQLQLKP